MNNVLIVTATKVETQAVLDLFPAASGTPWKREHKAGKTYYSLGQIGGVHVYLVQSEMGAVGPGGAVLTVRDAIDALSPATAIMVGIAFGMNPAKQQLGDILVAQQIMAYEPQKVGRKRIPRGDRVTATPLLLDKFRSGDIDWTGAKVRFGLVLSGEKLVNDPVFRKRLMSDEPEAIGGEMEGAGLYAAAYHSGVAWILVKAICDWADGTKTDDAQPLAARNAAAFALHVIQQGGLATLPAAAAAPTVSAPAAPASKPGVRPGKPGPAPSGGQRTVNTGGGSYFEGPVNVKGDFVAGDKTVHQNPSGQAASLRKPYDPDGILDDPFQEIALNEKTLLVARRTANRRAEAESLTGLGAAQIKLGMWQQAIERFQAALSIWREIGNRRGESDTLMGLGQAFSKLGDGKRAAACFDEAVRLAGEPDDPRHEDTSS